MTAPRWIAEAIEAAYDNGPGDGKLVTALIERLPLEAMARVLTEAQGNRGDQLAAILGVLSDGDPEVVELTELYQDACRALDEAGVPYAINVEIPPHIVIEATIGELAPRKEAEIRQVPAHPGTVHLGLPDRIRWLAQQRPIRAEVDAAQATRKLAEEIATKYMQERDAAKEALHLFIERVAAAACMPICDNADHVVAAIGGLAARERQTEELAEQRLLELSQLRKMHDGASADLDRERRERQDTEAAAANRELALTVELDNARRETKELKAAVVERNIYLRTLIESDFPAHELRRALAVLIGGNEWKLHLVDLERDTLRAKVADQAAYIEQLELEIAALEDEIWEDEP